MFKRHPNSTHQKRRAAIAHSYTHLESRQLLAVQPLSFAQSIVQSYYFALGNLTAQTMSAKLDSSDRQCDSESGQPHDCVDLAVTLSNFHFSQFDTNATQTPTVTVNSATGNGFNFFNSGTPSQDAPTSNPNDVNPPLNQTPTNPNLLLPPTRPPEILNSTNSTRQTNNLELTSPNLEGGLEPISTFASNLSALESGSDLLPLEIDHENYFLQTDAELKNSSALAHTDLLDHFQVFSLIDLDSLPEHESIGSVSDTNNQTAVPGWKQELWASVDRQSDPNDRAIDEAFGNELKQLSTTQVNHHVWTNVNYNSSRASDLPLPREPASSLRTAESAICRIDDQEDKLARIDEEITTISYEPSPLIESAIVAAFLITNFRRHPERDEEEIFN